MQNAFWLILPLSLAIGILMLGGVTLALKRRKREIAWLEEHGMHIMATVIRVQPLDAKNAFKGHSALIRTVRGMQQPYGDGSSERSYLLLAQWIDPQSHRQHIFRRRFSSSRVSQSLVGSAVEVLIDAHHPRRYFISLRPFSLFS